MVVEAPSGETFPLLNVTPPVLVKVTGISGSSLATACTVTVIAPSPPTTRLSEDGPVTMIRSGGSAGPVTVPCEPIASFELCRPQATVPDGAELERPNPVICVPGTKEASTVARKVTKLLSDESTTQPP